MSDASARALLARGAEGTRDAVLHIAPEVVTQLASWARRAVPHEACGTLLGRRDPHGARVVLALSARNASPTPRCAFDVHPVDLVRSEARAKELGLSFLGVWHSHPTGSARLSRADRRGVPSRWLQIVIAPGEVRAFWFGAGNASEAGQAQAACDAAEKGGAAEAGGQWSELRIEPPPSGLPADLPGD